LEEDLRRFRETHIDQAIERTVGRWLPVRAAAAGPDQRTARRWRCIVPRSGAAARVDTRSPALPDERHRRQKFAGGSIEDIIEPVAVRGEEKLSRGPIYLRVDEQGCLVR